MNRGLPVGTLAIALLLVGAVSVLPGPSSSGEDDPLHSRWVELWGRLERRGAVGDHEKVYRALVIGYGEAHRAYHNIAHIQHVLTELDAVRELADDPDAVEFALWCHDVVYNIGAGDNEAESAFFAREAVLGFGLGENWADRVAGLILATRHDVTPEDLDAQLMVDIDLSILGQPWEQFEAYDEAIRSEYAPVIEDRGVAGFNAGRTAILNRFLSRPRIYTTDHFQRKYDAQARANLRRAVERLEVAP